MAESGSYRPRAREDGLHVQVLGDELLVFDRHNDHAHSLNETAARVWRACDGTRGIDALQQACAIDRESLGLALELLHGTGLLEEPASPPTFSRRKLLGAAVALPVVISAVAPTAALAASAGTAVALCYAEEELAWAQDVQSKLQGTGRFSSVTLIDCGAGTPSVSTLQGYRAVITWGDGDYDDPTTLGNNLATYAAGGNIVVVMTFALGSEGEGYDIGGAIVAELPFVRGPYEDTPELTLVADVPGSPLLTGVSSFDGGSGSWRNAVSLAAGATQVAHWSNGEPLVAYLGNIVGLNFWPVSSDAYSGGWLSSTNGAALMANALLF